MTKENPTYHTLVLIQHLIVLAQTDQENQRGDVLEAVNPFLSFTPLSTDIEQSVRELADFEHRLCDTRGLHTRAQNVLVCRQVRWVRHAIDDVEVAKIA